MRLLVTTPTEITVDRHDVTSVVAEDASGKFGILNGHADFLTALAVCVISWMDEAGMQHYCAVRHGTLAVREGREISVATREALVGDDLDHLESVALAEFRQADEAESASRTESLQMQMVAVRQIIRYLRPQRGGVFGDGP